MAAFEGFSCDVCSRVWSNDMKTREKRTFTGFKCIGDYFQELCPECVVPPVGLTPVTPRRTKKSENHAEELQRRDTDDPTPGSPAEEGSVLLRRDFSD